MTITSARLRELADNFSYPVDDNGLQEALREAADALDAITQERDGYRDQCYRLAKIRNPLTHAEFMDDPPMFDKPGGTR